MSIWVILINFVELWPSLLHNILSEKVGKETAETLTSYIESKIQNDVNSLSKYLATEEDMERGLK